MGEVESGKACARLVLGEIAFDRVSLLECREKESLTSLHPGNEISQNTCARSSSFHQANAATRRVCARILTRNRASVRTGIRMKGPGDCPETVGGLSRISQLTKT